jgi:hypothetical protein
VSCVVCRVLCVVCRVSCVVCRVSCVVCRVSCVCALHVMYADTQAVNTTHSAHRATRNTHTNVTRKHNTTRKHDRLRTNAATRNTRNTQRKLYDLRVCNTNILFCVFIYLRMCCVWLFVKWCYLYRAKQEKQELFANLGLTVRTPQLSSSNQKKS